MSIFAGKSPEERNKIIAAIVLGALALLAIGYNLIGFFPGGKKTVTVSVSPTPSASSTVAAQTVTALPKAEDVDRDYVITPVSMQYPPGANDAGRNIFAFYEPPVPTPYSPTPVPVTPIKTPPTPTPAPTPNVIVSYISKQSAYAGEKGFKLDLGGSNFSPGTYVYWSGSQLPTNYVSPQQLSVEIPANFIATPGMQRVEVKSPDGKWFSNPVNFSIQAPPTPQFQYVGVVARKRGNNDTAYIQEQGKTSPTGVRLNDILGGRFRLVSISPTRLIVQDINLGFQHPIELVKGGAQTTSTTSQPVNPNFPPNGVIYNPNMPQYNPNNPNNPQYNPNNQPCPPGIPCGNIQQVRPPDNKKDVDDNDDNDDDN
ncbi:MAG: hypothetical protein JSS81_06475 [Acidobacteria bacterium]|nr:hypothetical protein [Acidobacteriota bacterium]